MKKRDSILQLMESKVNELWFDWLSFDYRKRSSHGDLTACLLSIHLVEGVSIDLPTMMKAKDERVNGLTSGVESLFKKNKVQGDHMICFLSSILPCFHAYLTLILFVYLNLYADFSLYSIL